MNTYSAYILSKVFVREDGRCRVEKDMLALGMLSRHHLIQISPLLYDLLKTICWK